MLHPGPLNRSKNRALEHTFLSRVRGNVKKFTPGLRWAAVFLAGSAAGFLLPHLSWKGGDRTALPTVFQEIRTMGELRTARVEATRVSTAESSLVAPSVFSWVIGVPEALKAVSTSEAGVQVSGRVEAGVDLAQAEFTHTDEGVLVRLPRAVLSEGPSQTDILWVKESWLNRDPSLALKASETGRKAILQSAGTAQLLLTAEKQAEVLVKDILSQAGASAVTVTWKDDSRTT